MSWAWSNPNLRDHDQGLIGVRSGIASPLESLTLFIKVVSRGVVPTNGSTDLPARPGYGQASR
jgi:hypothetical protein